MCSSLDDPSRQVRYYAEYVSNVTVYNPPRSTAGVLMRRGLLGLQHGLSGVRPRQPVPLGFKRV